MSKKCERCQKLDVWMPNFFIRCTLAELKMSSESCEFCKLLLTTRTFGSGLQTSSIYDDHSAVDFYRVRSRLATNDNNMRGLSICKTRTGEASMSSPCSDIQLGFPLLPEIESPTYYGLLRGWLEDCDNHLGCRPENNMTDSRTTPTRLIDVGTISSRMVYLLETRGWNARQKADSRYIALSHPWGNPEHHNHFSTTRKNYDNRLKDGIVFGELPATFKDAVKVTRELGMQYLWIDSLCIIQGDDGDFRYEAEFMETVFSFAYCVIAASRATGASDGFLKQRPDRRFVEFATPSGDELYICEGIDDFQHDVIEGALNKRGWVLQERALARRTIYFTEVQTYWECGEGIRCETLTKMRNDKAAFLGDPAFPKVATNSTKGSQIRLYESLYQQYSALQFSKVSDRPMAIAGLEQRLVRAFGQHGGFGVFDRYFGRSLLWQRDGDIPMRDIEFASEQYRIPTWSWMAYEGRITFMDIPFDGVHWEKSQIRSPWTNSLSSSSCWHTGDENTSHYLRGRARDMNMALATEHIVCDRGDPPSDRVIKCVIIGSQKPEVASSIGIRMHYVLIVAKILGVEDDLTFERIGIGSLLGSWIELDGRGLEVRIY